MLRKSHCHSRMLMKKYDITMRKLIKLTRGGMTKYQVTDSA